VPHHNHHVAVAEELSYHLEARSHGSWYLLGRCLAASSPWHFLSPWHAICGERRDTRCYPEVKTAAVGLQGLRECVMGGMCGQGAVCARVSSPDGVATPAVWLWLSSPAGMQKIFFLSHNDSHQGNGIGASFITSDRRIGSSMNKPQCELMRQGETRVRQRCQYQEPSHGKLICSGASSACEPCRCLTASSLLSLFHDVVVQSILDLYSTMVYTHQNFR
jgi:hypothetical protein